MTDWYWQESICSISATEVRRSIKGNPLLIANNQWNASVNRLYYAAYYAVSALLVLNKIETKTHSGVKTQFLLNFVKTGVISVQEGKLYNDLFDWRQKGDYGDLFDFNGEDVTPLLNPIKDLINELKKLALSSEKI